MTLQQAKSEVRFATRIIKQNRKMGISDNGVKFGGRGALAQVKRMTKGFDIVKKRGGFLNKGAVSEFNLSARKVYLEYIKAVRSPAKVGRWYR